MANVEWLFVDHATRSSVTHGDLVSAEAGGLPIYEVMDVTEGRAWVRDESQRDHIIPIGRLRWRLLRPRAGAH